ncbi:MAG: TrkH family potassium uptake protein [Ruminococcus sp.]
MKFIRKLSATQYIMLCFIFVILVGAGLLTLPISHKSGVSMPYIDALFTATSATCVTGLVTVTTADWSIFGQIIILCLIQTGGLGVVTMVTGVMLILRKRIGLTDRQLIQDAFNLNSMAGLVKFVKKVFLGTLLIEVIGALLYMIVFVPDFGPVGIWYSFFNSVSAFCNAGMDIIGTNSLCDYATNPLINAVTCTLIILGGLGFFVWWDFVRIIKEKKSLKNLTLHSKTVLTATAALIVFGALLIFIFEFNNPKTIGEHNIWEKIEISFFQSITARTAGFASVPQENLTPASALIVIVLMCIGGSPGGTAGGIKTVTVAVIIAAAISSVFNKNSIVMLRRQVSVDNFKKAVAVTTTFFSIALFTTVFVTALLGNSPDVSALDIVYETISATGTVGLSRGLTSMLDNPSKIAVILAMYLGRIGPISLAIAISPRKRNQNMINEPVESVSIG